MTVGELLKRLEQIPENTVIMFDLFDAATHEKPEGSCEFLYLKDVGPTIKKTVVLFGTEKP